ncbi:MAG: hypothetical protein JJT78_04485 [Leptospira sp.]|nr:hypothetical protein [Leptospira sp.]
MTGRSDDALYYLRSGDFEKAKEVFSRLLDTNPGHPEWQGGFFLSSYWDNKVDHLLSLREGSERGRALLGYLKDFEKTINSRKFPKNEFYEVAATCILEEITHHLGVAFRVEGWNGLEPETILGFASSHLRLKNFQKAIEILEFRSDSKFRLIEFQYLRAEAFIGLGKIEDGIELYIRCFIDDPTKLPIDSVQSLVIRKLFSELTTRYPEDSLSYLLLPIYLKSQSLLSSKNSASENEVNEWYNLLQRLYSNGNQHSGKYKIKTLLRCYFIGSVLMEKATERAFPQEVGEVKKILIEAKANLSDLLPG